MFSELYNNYVLKNFLLYHLTSVGILDNFLQNIYISFQMTISTFTSVYQYFPLSVCQNFSVLLALDVTYSQRSTKKDKTELLF